jgi:hypothetical protein
MVIMCRGRCRKERSMNRIVLGWWLATFFCVAATGCVAEAPTAAQLPGGQSDSVQLLNQPVSTTLTCSEIKALRKASDKRTVGLAILWLDGYYSGRSGLTGLPADWTRTVAQGVGGTCAITVNERRTVLDVIGQLHREYGNQAKLE